MRHHIRREGDDPVFYHFTPEFCVVMRGRKESKHEAGFDYPGSVRSHRAESFSPRSPLMALVEPPHRVKMQMAREWFDCHLRFEGWDGRRPEEDGSRLESITLRRDGWSPWILTWFSHTTYRAGRTDSELKESFERWVRKHQHHQDTPARGPCLMGAEDRWRWKWCDCAVCKSGPRVVVTH